MGLRFEWRSKAEGDDSLLAVEDHSNKVLEAWTAEPAILTDFLNDMKGLSPRREGGNAEAQTPDDWGALVIARDESGDVLSVEPQLYWEGVAYWFRSRGEDPHPYRGRA